MNPQKLPLSRWLRFNMLALAFAHLGYGAQDYYVDATSGSDLNVGTSVGAAWQTLSRANTGPAATSGVYQPGDRILLKSGGVWSGSLYPRGSGTSANYIHIDKYGGAARPIINGGGAFPSRSGIARVDSAAVWLYNQKYWEIRNLEITNYVSASTSDVLNPAVSSDGDRWGILIEVPPSTEVERATPLPAFGAAFVAVYGPGTGSREAPGGGEVADKKSLLAFLLGAREARVAG